MPDMQKKVFTPSADAPSTSASSATRLRSRVHRLSTASTFSAASSTAQAKAEPCACSAWSPTITPSSDGGKHAASFLTAAGSVPCGGIQAAVTTDFPLPSFSDNLLFTIIFIFQLVRDIL